MQKFAYHDADKVHFTADTHFGHAAIINMCGRPFASVDKMDEELVQRWNDVVKPSDTVWHLGDFAHKANPYRVNEIFARLNGTKHLILGNHDKRPAMGLGWKSIHDLVELDVAGQRITLCHYAMRTWPGAGPRGKAIFMGIPTARCPAAVILLMSASIMSATRPSGSSTSGRRWTSCRTSYGSTETSVWQNTSEAKLTGFSFQICHCSTESRLAGEIFCSKIVTSGHAPHVRNLQYFSYRVSNLAPALAGNLPGFCYKELADRSNSPLELPH